MPSRHQEVSVPSTKSLLLACLSQRKEGLSQRWHKVEILNLVNGNQVQDCINNCESRLAEMILTNIREASEMPRQLLQRIGQSYNVRNFDSNWNLR